MTTDDFRNLALTLPEAVEDEHMGHPDFRVRKKIFATIPRPDDACGMVKLTPEEQTIFVRSEPEVYRPVNGAWGRQGCTYVELREASVASVRQALIAAWLKAAPKRLAQEFEDA